MDITITERLKPYSHLPGTTCLLPGSSLIAEIYPALLRFCDASVYPFQSIGEIQLNIKGPVKGFTIQLDLEKGQIVVWGDTSVGFFRYRIEALSKVKGIVWSIEKVPYEGLQGSLTSLLEAQLQKHGGTLLKMSGPISLNVKDVLYLLPKESQFCDSLYSPPKMDRLSLGCHKAQEWEMVTRRLNFAEIFPYWHRLGQLIPSLPSNDQAIGTLSLLQRCQEVVENESCLDVIPAFQDLFLAAFKNLLIPLLEDERHQGFLLPSFTSSSLLSSLTILKKGSELIRRLFIHSEANSRIHLLPVLPPDFHCGRLLDVPIDDVGHFDLEWSKKTIRRIIFKPSQSGKIQLYFKKQIKSFRVRNRDTERGRIFQAGDLCEVIANQYYFFDNFQR